MKAIGIKINIQNYDANTFFGTNLPSGTYQIAEFAWVSTPFVSGNQSIYCSYTNTANCGAELDPLGQLAGGQADGRGLGRPEPVPGDHRLQQGRRHPVAEHGHAARCTRSPQFWAWSNNLKGVLPEHVQRRRHLERRELVASARSRLTGTRGRGRPSLVGPSLNVPTDT